LRVCTSRSPTTSNIITTNHFYTHKQVAIQLSAIHSQRSYRKTFYSFTPLYDLSIRLPALTADIPYVTTLSFKTKGTVQFIKLCDVRSNCHLNAYRLHIKFEMLTEMPTEQLKQPTLLRQQFTASRHVL